MVVKPLDSKCQRIFQEPKTALKVCSRIISTMVTMLTAAYNAKHKVELSRAHIKLQESPCGCSEWLVHPVVERSSIKTSQLAGELAATFLTPTRSEESANFCLTFLVQVQRDLAFRTYAIKVLSKTCNVLFVSSAVNHSCQGTQIQ